jgi:hypothetical protein
MLKKCRYCNQRYRFEQQHNKECWKRRAILKRSKVEIVQENRTGVGFEQIDSLPAIVETTPIKIEMKPKKKKPSKAKQ